MALERFIDQNNIKAMMIQETGNWTPSIGSFDNKYIAKNDLSLYPERYGVAMIMHKSLNPVHINELDESKDEEISITCMLAITEEDKHNFKLPEFICVFV